MKTLTSPVPKNVTKTGLSRILLAAKCKYESLKSLKLAAPNPNSLGFEFMFPPELDGVLVRS
jgi:hypothetical protein